MENDWIVDVPKDSDPMCCKLEEQFAKGCVFDIFFLMPAHTRYQEDYISPCKHTCIPCMYVNLHVNIRYSRALILVV